MKKGFVISCKQVVLAVAHLSLLVSLPMVGALPTLVQVLPPISGSSSAYLRGQYYKKGYAIAVEEFNANGGLSWRGSAKSAVTVETVHDSGASELDKFLTGHPALESENDPIVVLGGYGSSNIAKQINCTDTHGALFLNGGGADAVMYYPREHGGVNDRKLAFGLLSSVERMAVTTMDYLAERVRNGDLPAPLRIALLWEDKSHGWAYQEVVTSYALAYPELFTVAYASDFELNTDSEARFEFLAEDLHYTHKTFAALDPVQGIGALLVDAHTEDFIKLQNVLAKHSFDFKFVTYGARGADPAEVARLQDPRLNNNTIAAQWWNPVMSTDANRAFVASWRLAEAYSWADELDQRATQQKDSSALFELADSQLPILWYGALGYATAKVALEALSLATVQTRTGVKEFLQQHSFSTILPGGSLSFDDYGQAQYKSTIVQSRIDDDGVPIAETLFPAADASADFQVKSGWDEDMRTCDQSFIGSLQTSCNTASKRTTRFFWTDASGVICQDPLTPCDCVLDGSIELQQAIETECEYLPLNSTNGILVLVCASTAAVLCFFALVIVLWSYNSLVMKAGQREFLALMVWSGIWCNFSAISYLGPNTSSACISRMFFTVLSLTLLIGSLTVKVYRIYKIWSNRSMRRIVVTTRDMLMVLGAIMLGIFVLFCVWMFTGPPKAVTKTSEIILPGGMRFEMEATTCVYSDSPIMPSLCISYIVMILLFCNVLSFQGRNSDSKYLESKSILLASYCITFVFILVLTCATALDLPASSLVLVVALGLIFSSSSLISFVVGPKLYFVTQVGLSTAKRAVGSAARRSSKKTTLNSVEEYMDATEYNEEELEEEPDTAIANLSTMKEPILTGNSTSMVGL